MPDYITLREAEKQERTLLEKAENFETFGTLTSLGASALWFAEGAVGKAIPKAVHELSLAAVSVGIGSVLYSFKLRQDAKKVALNDDELLLRNPARAGTASTGEPKPWAERQTETASASVQR